eukprot:TRINITY_DN13259_c0_g1_i1.p1 TRINITY_DN13259_c0_g1~~TRINITY_DN13259_c0_g1_i1.p1  ORF type:complete len:263 (+),score=56.92 TRINITY_DN13259_c0_g1_i1:31-819(+)
MAVLVARHGERADYVDGAGFFATAHGKERPWDPPLTEVGREQGLRLGARIRDELAARGLPPLTKVYTSPFIRTVETADAVCEAVGLDTLRVENGLVEALVEPWFRSWGTPGCTGHWGGDPARAYHRFADDDVHPLAHTDPSRWLLSHRELHERVTARVCCEYSSHTPVVDRKFNWASPEPWRGMQQRCDATVRAVAAAHPEESALFITHGGPAASLDATLAHAPDDDHLYSYTALFGYAPKHGAPTAHPWDCFVRGCSKHLQ